jgi:hypothetical protein
MRYAPSSRRNFDIFGIEQASQPHCVSCIGTLNGLHTLLYSHRSFPGFGIWEDHMAAYGFLTLFLLSVMQSAQICLYHMGNVASASFVNWHHRLNRFINLWVRSSITENFRIHALDF